MKKGLIIVALFIVLVSIFVIGFKYLYPGNDTDVTLSSLSTSIGIERDTMNLGKVKYGEKRQAIFRIHNTGSEPLLILDVQPSCGCTGVEWSKRPVRPDKTTEISIVFNSSSLGTFMKSIDVACNTTRRIHKLYLKGEVVE